METKFSKNTILKYLLIILFLINTDIFGQTISKCKFISYTTSTNTNFQLTSYCGGRHHRYIRYGEEKYTIANFYDLSKKRMLYIKKREVRQQYCYSWGHWLNSWIHDGFKETFIKNKIYYFNLKKIEYTL